MNYPVSPKEEIDGVVYFRRLCSKIRLFQAGKLDEAYRPNMGRAMDLWACQFLQVEYNELRQKVESGATDEEAYQWAIEAGKSPNENEKTWWNSYMRNVGFRDFLAEKLAFRIEEAGFEEKNILTFFDFIDADEERG